MGFGLTTLSKTIIWGEEKVAGISAFKKTTLVVVPGPQALPEKNLRFFGKKNEAFLTISEVHEKKNKNFVFLTTFF